MWNNVVHWIAAGALVAVILRVRESFYIDEAFDLAMDVLFWPVAVILHIRGDRGDKDSGSSHTE